jgi:hypothetical protein
VCFKYSFSHVIHQSTFTQPCPYASGTTILNDNRIPWASKWDISTDMKRVVSYKLPCYPDNCIIVQKWNAIYNSSLTPVVPAATSRGQHKAGLVALNLYSHFSGSEIESSALVVPQDNSTVADRMGPFQHFALLFNFSSSWLRVMHDLPIGVSLFCVVVEWSFWGGIIPSGECAIYQLCPVNEWLTLGSWMNYPCCSSA